MSSDARARALSVLTRFKVSDPTAGDTLQRLAEITLDAMPRAALAGMTVPGEDQQPTTAIYTDEESPEIDAVQYREDRGPCLDAWRTGTIVRLDRVDDAVDTYPAFVAACAEHGVRSVLSLPMVVGESSVGSMNLYARVQEAFDDDDEDLGSELAAAAGSVLANVSAYWTAFEVSQQLEEAMSSRSVIEQAKGILMAGSPGLDADGAFDLLRQASSRENIKLRQIAQRIVDRRTRGDDPAT